MTKQKKQDRLFLYYRMHGTHLYGAVRVVRESHDNQLATYPFVISKRLGARKIVYGSLVHLMAKIIDLISTSMNIGPDLASIPEETKASSVQHGRHIGVFMHALPESEHSESILHQQDQTLEEKVILVAVQLRNLLDILLKKDEVKINLYDYEGKPIDKISLRQFVGLVIHHRYIFVDGIYIHDIVSDKKELPSKRLFGSKVNIVEFFDAALDVVNGITIKDFVDVLRSRLPELSASSESRDIIFAIQNVHALTNVIRNEIANKEQFSPLADLLFFAERENIVNAAMQRHPGIKKVDILIKFSMPEFKIANDLSKKAFEAHLSINDKPKIVEIAFETFFDAIIEAYGNKALVMSGL